MKLTQKIIIGVIGAAIFFGFKFYRKNQYAQEMKATIANLCGDNQDCLEDLDLYFKTCFDRNYSIGGKRRGASFKTNRFVTCFNQMSGKLHLSTDEKN